jgi:hypothetical protein
MTAARGRADEWICTRRFVAESRGKRRFATAKIGHPRKSGKDWACSVVISNIGMTEPRLAYGVDPMQAVILALECVRVTLTHTGTRWRWIHGERDETGIPKYVPIAFGRKFASRLEAMIDAETEKLADAAERRRHKARRRSLFASRYSRPLTTLGKMP